MAMPPKVGIAIGIMTSAPLPDDDNIGSKASNVVAVVIKVGRILLFPASTTEFLMA